jgi:hypothetical protein
MESKEIMDHMDSKEQLGHYYGYQIPATPRTNSSHEDIKSPYTISNDSHSIVSPVEPADVRPVHSHGLWSKCRPIGSLLWSFLIFAVFSILHCLFIVFVLIRGEVIIGSVTFDASTTNLLVSIFSQASAILADTSLRQMLGALRLFFATSTKGTSAFTWFGIGLSSQWITTARFAAASYLLNAWCLFRLLLPLLNLGFGSVIKFQADFDYYFVPSAIEVPVFAGLTPVDTKLLGLVSTPDLCQYFTTWASSLQGNSRYAAETSIDGCGDDCQALVWPGGLETVRQVGPYLNTSIFHDNYFDNVDAIRIASAIGWVTTFKTLPEDFMFDNKKDCVFGGKINDDGFKVCVKQMGDDIAAGWVSCPQRILDKGPGSCEKDEEWKTAAMKSQLLMSAYRQHTTTTYSRQNLSILHIIPETEPTHFPLKAKEYLDIFDELLVPKVSAVSVKGNANLANASISALTHALTWVHRVYGEIFTDEQNTLVTVLSNFLSIPLQFAVTTQQLANYTVAKSPALLQVLGEFPQSEDMITTATGGSSTQRLVIKEWTGWTFIAVDAAVLLAVLFGIVCILRQVEPLPTLTGLTELDILIEADRMVCVEKGGQLPLRDLPIVSGSEPPSNYTTSLRPWRMRYTG